MFSTGKRRQGIVHPGAKLISVAGDRFAVEFLNQTEAEKDGLYQCLVYEMRRDMVV